MRIEELDGPYEYHPESGEVTRDGQYVGDFRKQARMIQLVQEMNDQANMVAKLQARLAGVDAGTHKIVPVESYRKMLGIGTMAYQKAYIEKVDDREKVERIYKAMLEAVE